jgi:hypothetical protein
MSHITTFKRFALGALLCSAFSAHAAQADGSSEAMSNASELVVSGGAVVVVLGTLASVDRAGTAVVASVEWVGESAVVVLEGASDAASATIKLSAQGARSASLKAGQVVSVVAMSTGYAVVAASVVIAFIPLALGSDLLHHSRLSERRS